MAPDGRPLIEFLGISQEEERMARQGPPPPAMLVVRARARVNGKGSGPAPRLPATAPIRLYAVGSVTNPAA